MRPSPVWAAGDLLGIAQGFAIYTAEGNDAPPYFPNFDMPLAAYAYCTRPDDDRKTP